MIFDYLAPASRKSISAYRHLVLATEKTKTDGCRLKLQRVQKRWRLHFPEVLRVFLDPRLADF